MGLLPVDDSDPERNSSSSGEKSVFTWKLQLNYHCIRTRAAVSSVQSRVEKTANQMSRNSTK